MINPKRPIALPKISMMRILTKRELLAASASAAPDPTMPTHTPQARLLSPTVRPAPNILKPGTPTRKGVKGMALCIHNSVISTSVLLYSRLCPSTAGSSPPSFSVLCYPCPYYSLLPHNILSPRTFWSSDWSYTLYLLLCASNSPSIIFHSVDVSSPFPFRIGYVLDCLSLWFFA